MPEQLHDFIAIDNFRGQDIADGSKEVAISKADGNVTEIGVYLSVPESHAIFHHSTFFQSSSNSPTLITMYRFAKLLCFVSFVAFVTSRCTTSKYRETTRSWLKCSNSSVEEAKANLTENFIAVLISQSKIPKLPSSVFGVTSLQLEVVNFHNCGINDIENDTFRGLYTVKQLGLSYNNITTVQVLWFFDLPNLEDLDLSYNKITTLDSNVYMNLRKLRTLELNDNLLTCLPTVNLELMNQLKNIRIEQNPLTYKCRAEITLALQRRNIAYASHDDVGMLWLDTVLWECSSSLVSANVTDADMNNCAIVNMLNQLSPILEESPAMKSIAEGCSNERKAVTTCLQNRKVVTNGELVLSLLKLVDDTSSG